MTDVWTQSFEVATLRHFGEVASQVGLRLVKLREGIFEINGNGYVIRIRKGLGYHREFFVTVCANSDLSDDPGDPLGEIGLGRAAEFNGASIEFGRTDSVESLKLEIEKAAHWSKSFLVGYLTGGRSDYEGLKNFVIFPRTISHEVRKLMEDPPPNVRKMWDK